MGKLHGPKLPQRAMGCRADVASDGIEASRRITAKWPSEERPRLVAMTADAKQGEREQCLAASMDDCVTLPIRVEALVEALLAAGTRDGR